MAKTRRESLWMGAVLLALLAVPGVALAGGETPSQWQGMVVETGHTLIGWLFDLLVNLFTP